MEVVGRSPGAAAGRVGLPRLECPNAEPKSGTNQPQNNHQSTAQLPDWLTGPDTADHRVNIDRHLARVKNPRLAGSW